MVSVIHVDNSKIIHLKCRMPEPPSTLDALTLRNSLWWRAQFWLAGCLASQIPVLPWLLASIMIISYETQFFLNRSKHQSHHNFSKKARTSFKMIISKGEKLVIWHCTSLSPVVERVLVRNWKTTFSWLL